MRRPISITFEKSLKLMQIVNITKSVDHFVLKKNSGYANVLRSPVSTKFICDVWCSPEEFGENLNDFVLWLNARFKNLENSEYILIGFDKSVRKIVKKSHGKIISKQYVRPWRRFARFTVSGGTISMDKSQERNARNQKYLVWSMFEEQPVTVDNIYRDFFRKRGKISYGR
jgi:hypothetical protein